MTDDEKRIALASRIAPDTDTDEVLESMLSTAGALILNRMYPFGYDEAVIIPPRYEQIQIQLATELYTQRGAEGQSSHSENGTNRSWPEKNRLLSGTLPSRAHFQKTSGNTLCLAIWRQRLHPQLPPRWGEIEWQKR